MQKIFLNMSVKEALSAIGNAELCIRNNAVDVYYPEYDEPEYNNGIYATIDVKDLRSGEVDIMSLIPDAVLENACYKDNKDCASDYRRLFETVMGNKPFTVRLKGMTEEQIT